MPLRWEWLELWPEKFLPKHDSEFISHLEELRRRLLFILVFFSIASIVSYVFAKDILDFLIEPLRRHQDVQLVFQRPYEAFLTHLKAAALTGAVVTSPIFFYQAWVFIMPGLYDNEKKAIIPLIAASTVLFLIGTTFAYNVVIPWGLHFLMGFQTESLKPFLGVGPYFSFLIGMILAFGILFDFPVILVGLVRLGVTTSAQLAKGRRFMIVIIFILAAILTPSPDPISQLMLAGPLVILFEASLVVARFVEKKS